MQVGANYLGNGQCEFTVWGPTLDSAAVQLVSQENSLIAMERQNDGYWRAITTDVQPGTR